MTSALPEGWTWRRPAAPEDDAAEVFALVARCNEAVIGVADWTLDDAVEQLGEPGFDPAHDGWLVHDDDGTLVGFACVQHEGDAQVGAELFTLDDRVTAWLLAAITERADDLARSAGHGSASIIFGVYREDDARRALLAEHGYESATTFRRMRIDHDAATPIEPPEPPPGVVVRTGPGDETFRREAHDIKETSLQGPLRLPSTSPSSAGMPRSRPHRPGTGTSCGSPRSTTDRRPCSTPTTASSPTRTAAT